MGHEECWGTLTCMLDDQIRELDGGMPELATRVLDHFFGRTHNAMTSGIRLQLRQQQQQQQQQQILISSGNRTASVAASEADEWKL